MDEIGYVFTPLDLKILILYLLRRLPDELDRDDLQRLCQEVGVVNYFDYAISLDELAESGQITQDEGYCALTERGAQNADTLGDSLPYSVKQRAAAAAERVAEEMKRQQNIAVNAIEENGMHYAEMHLNDGISEILSLRLLCADLEQAKRMGRRFRRNAEKIYQETVELLSGEQKGSERT